MQAKNEIKCMQNLSPCIMNVLKIPTKKLRQLNFKAGKKTIQILHKRIQRKQHLITQEKVLNIIKQEN